MILTSLIVGGIIAAGVIGIIATFWDDILAFLKKALAKVKSIVKGIVYGAQVFMKKLVRKLRGITPKWKITGKKPL